MITWSGILLVMGLLAALMGVNTHLKHERRYKNYSKEVIVHKIDSLMAQKVDVWQNSK